MPSKRVSQLIAALSLSLLIGNTSYADPSPDSGASSASSTNSTSGTSSASSTNSTSGTSSASSTESVSNSNFTSGTDMKLINLSPKSKGVDDPSGQALTLIFAGKETDAKDILLKSYQKNKSPDADVPYFLAVFELRTNNEVQAIKYLNEARAILNRQNVSGPNKSPSKELILLDKRLADCYYQSHDLKKALSLYELVYSSTKTMPDCPPILAAEVLGSIAACQTELKLNDEAEKNLKLLVDTTSKNAQIGNIAGVVRYWWALAQLADHYRMTNQLDKLTPIKQQLRTLLTGMVEARMAAEANGLQPDFDTMVRQYRMQYIQAFAPKTPAELAWAANDFKVRSLPVIAWKAIGKPKAAILCVHGLGLENRSFADTARELNKRGYQVYGLDVRGFGSWAQTKGVEDLDYEQTITDIGNAVQVIKSKNNNIPIFVLGESMGGAIAIRAASILGKKIDGVIASVPSAERFQQKKMTFQTTLHFLKDPKEPFDVGYVAEMATSDEATRRQWEKDPKARLSMTPIELLEFAVFMRRTTPQAEKITELPVLMLQGLKDRLVKPQGTFDLFDAVKSPDKTILIIGTAEHLMFENPHPDKLLMDTVDSWLKTHIDAQQASTTPAAR